MRRLALIFFVCGSIIACGDEDGTFEVTGTIKEFGVVFLFQGFLCINLVEDNETEYHFNNVSSSTFDHGDIVVVEVTKVRRAPFSNFCPGVEVNLVAIIERLN